MSRDELADDGATSADWSGYQAAADAMWMAALAAFNAAATEVGATGFQAGWAVMKFVAKANHIDGPFMLVKIEDALYPQYNLPQRVETFIAEQAEWLRDEAAKKIAAGVEHVHPMVLAHWVKLATAEVSR